MLCQTVLSRTHYGPSRLVLVLAILIYTDVPSFPANAAPEAGRSIRRSRLDLRIENGRLQGTRHNREWPCSVALPQRESVRFVLCTGRINLRFAAERQSGH